MAQARKNEPAESLGGLEPIGPGTVGDDTLGGLVTDPKVLEVFGCPLITGNLEAVPVTILRDPYHNPEGLRDFISQLPPAPAAVAPPAESPPPWALALLQGVGEIKASVGELRQRVEAVEGREYDHPRIAQPVSDEPPPRPSIQDLREKAWQETLARGYQNAFVAPVSDTPPIDQAAYVPVKQRTYSDEEVAGACIYFCVDKEGNLLPRLGNDPRCEKCYRQYQKEVQGVKQVHVAKPVLEMEYAGDFR